MFELFRINRKRWQEFYENLNIQIFEISAGVAHMDEVIYLFPVRKRMFPTALPTKEEEKVQKAMIQMWTDFARTG